jgi:hypothetical protein
MVLGVSRAVQKPGRDELRARNGAVDARGRNQRLRLRDRLGAGHDLGFCRVERRVRFRKSMAKALHDFGSMREPGSAELRHRGGDLGARRGPERFFEREREIPSGLEAPLRIALEGAHDDGIELANQSNPEVARRADGHRENVHQGGALGRAGQAKQAVSGQRFPENDTGGKDVRPAIDRARRRLLGRHVSGFSRQLSRARDVGLAGCLRNAEVEHLHGAVLADHDVLRRNVAVHELKGAARAVGCFVRGVEAVKSLIESPDYDPRRQHDVGSLCVREEFVKRDAVDELHDERELVLRFDHIERLDDVRMRQRRDESNLVLEASAEGGVLREVSMQALDRDESPEA